MGYSNNIVSKPISMGDISSAVGYSSLDLGTLITRGIIKWWSKAKPFQYSAIAFNEDDGVTTKTRVAARKEANQGFNLGTMYQSASACLNAAIALGNNVFAWSYQRPTSYFRMLDFDGYDSSKNDYDNCPFKYRPDSNKLYTGDVWDINTTSVEPNWSVSDFATLEGWKLCLIFRRPNDTLENQTSYFTFDKTTELSASDMTGTGETYNCCIAFAQNSKDIDEDRISNFFYLTPLPYFQITRASGCPVSLTSCNLIDNTSANNIVMTAIGQNRTITDIQAVWRKSITGNAWSTPSTGEANGSIIIDTHEISTSGTTLLYNGRPAILRVSSSDITTPGYLFLRFRYNGYQQQTLLTAGGSTPTDKPSE